MAIVYVEGAESSLDSRNGGPSTFPLLCTTSSPGTIQENDRMEAYELRMIIIILLLLAFHVLFKIQLARAYGPDFLVAAGGVR